MVKDFTMYLPSLVQPTNLLPHPLLILLVEGEVLATHSLRAIKKVFGFGTFAKEI